MDTEERVLNRLRASVCTIKVSADDVVPTGVYKNTDFGFFYFGGSTGAGHPRRGGPPYFEAGFTEHYLTTPLAVLGPYTQYYQVTLPGGEKIIALLDRYYYQQLQAQGQLALPVGKLSLLVVDNTARTLLQKNGQMRLPAIRHFLLQRRKRAAPQTISNMAKRPSTGGFPQVSDRCGYTSSGLHYVISNKNPSFKILKDGFFVFDSRYLNFPYLVFLYAGLFAFVRLIFYPTFLLCKSSSFSGTVFAEIVCWRF